MSFKRNILFAALLFIAALLILPGSSLAEATDTAEASLPAPVLAQVHTPLKLVGEGNYRKLGLKIYHASLWAPDGVWRVDKPFVLKMQYARSLSKDTVIDALMDDIGDQKVTDDATLDRWRAALNTSMPPIEEDDTIIGVSLPGKKAMLFHNNDKLGGIDDKAFGEAFFNIWLGPTADSSLHKKLLGQDD